MSKNRQCIICGDTNSCGYYKWSAYNGVCIEYKGADVCNKHYTQMVQYRKLLDNTPSDNIKRKYWDKQEIKLLEKLYQNRASMENMVEVLGRTKGSITSKAINLGLTDKYMKTNNPKFKAVYHDYDWCYERFISKNMTHQEMADEIGVSKRVIQKWCVEKHGIHRGTYKQHKKLTDIQKQVIMFGLLGDGHIDRRENQPMYIESHAENQKDYLYWKYEILKDICNKKPSYTEPFEGVVSGIECDVQAQYRFNTKIVDELKEIRSMKRIDIIKQLNEFGLSLHTLDDGHRSKSQWSTCLAKLTKEELDLYISTCKEKFGLTCYQGSDKRYIKYNAKSSRMLDEIILRNIPNSLDIIKYKITDNYICEPNEYIFIHLQSGEKMGLSSYCRVNKIPHAKYIKSRDLLRDKEIDDITEENLINMEVM